MPKGASGALPYPSKALAMGAVPFAAMGATMAHAAPAVPAAPAKLAATDAKQNHLGDAAQKHLAAPTDAKSKHPGDAKPKQSGASGEAASPGQSAKKARARRSTAITEGTKIDAGTSGNAAARYNRVKAAVKAGQLKPSIRAIQKAEGGGPIVVQRYLRQLEADGVTVRAGQGWKAAAVAATKGGSA